MQGSDRLRRLAVVAVALAAASCSARTVIAVDPYPCLDAGPTGCPPGLLDGLIGFWRLNDAPGSTVARDWSGWGNDGTLVGLDPSTAWVTGGPEGSALSLQAKGYVNVPDSPSIDSITNQVTVVASMYLTATVSDYATAISRQIGVSDNQLYHLSVDPNQQARLIIDATAGFLMPTSSNVAPLNTWLNLAGTWDGTEARLYLDGAEIANGQLTSGPFAPETNPLVLGGNGNGTNMAVTELIPGELGDVMLYRRALSADEIARLANGALLPGGTRSDGGGQ